MQAEVEQERQGLSEDIKESQKQQRQRGGGTGVPKRKHSPKCLTTFTSPSRLPSHEGGELQNHLGHLKNRAT